MLLNVKSLRILQTCFAILLVLNQRKLFLFRICGNNLHFVNNSVVKIHIVEKMLLSWVINHTLVTTLNVSGEKIKKVIEQFFEGGWLLLKKLGVDC